MKRKFQDEVEDFGRESRIMEDYTMTWEKAEHFEGDWVIL
jgi:hypothetical protein